MQWGRVLFVVSLMLVCAEARATITVTPVNGNEDTEASSPTFYFPIIGPAGTCSAGRINPGGTALDSTASGVGLKFKIKSTATFDSIRSTSTDPIVIRVETSANLPIALIPDGTSYVSGAGDSYNVKYGDTENAEVSFTISAQDIASPAGVGICDADRMSAGCQSVAGATPKYIDLIFGIVKNGDDLRSSNANKDVSETVRVVFANCPPGVDTTPLFSLNLIPGDGRMKVIHTGSVPDAGGVPVRSVVVFGEKTSSPTVTASIQKTFDGTGGGTYIIESLQNDQEYCFSIAYRNLANLISTDATWSATLPSSKCGTPSQIDGFLERSTCFIATAAYGDEWDPRLMVLRQFRDQILEHSSVGRSFVQWYYSWSPGAAHWILKNPEYKSAIRVALFPIVESARFALWMRTNIWFSVLGFVVLIFAAIRIRRRGIA